MITFKYRKEKGRLGNIIDRPVALVEFRSSNGKWVSEYLYIDSGADITLVPRSVGDLLGFELDLGGKSIEEIGGIAGSLPVVHRRVKTKIGSYELEVEIVWALTEEVPLLLGRKDVFDAFHITFRQDQGLVDFKKVPPV